MPRSYRNNRLLYANSTFLAMLVLLLWIFLYPLAYNLYSGFVRLLTSDPFLVFSNIQPKNRFLIILGLFAGVFFLILSSNLFSRGVLLDKTGWLQIGRTTREIIIFGVRPKSNWGARTSDLTLSLQLFSFLQEIGGNLLHVGLPEQYPSHYLLAVLPKSNKNTKLYTRQHIVASLTHMSKYQIFLLRAVPHELLSEFQDIFNSSLRLVELSTNDPLLNPLEIIQARGNPYVVFLARSKNNSKLIFAERSRFSFLGLLSKVILSKRTLHQLLLGNEVSALDDDTPSPSSLALVIHNGSQPTSHNSSEPMLHLGHDMLTKEIISLPASFLNYNAQIIGSVGKGKSTLLSFLIPQISEANISVIVFDPKGEYTELLSGFNPIVMELGSEDGLRINLFDNVLFDDYETIIAIFQEVLRDSGNDLSPSMIRILREVLLLTSKSGVPSLKTFVSILHQKRSALVDRASAAERMSYDGLINRLALIFSEPVFNLLNTSEIGSNIICEQLDHNPQRILILDMLPLTKGVRATWDYKFLTTIILRLLLKRAINKGKSEKLNQLLVFEESLFTFSQIRGSHELSTSEALLLLGRAHGMGSILVSQDPAAFSSLIQGNSSTKVIFQLSSSPTHLSHSIGISEDMANDVTQFGIGEYLILSPFLDSPRRAKLLPPVSSPICSQPINNPANIELRKAYSEYDVFLNHLNSGLLTSSKKTNSGAPAGI